MSSSRRSFLSLLGLASISPSLFGGQTNEVAASEASALDYVARVNTAQVVHGTVNGRYTDRIEELRSVAKLPEPPTGWRLTIAVHDDKWDLVMLQEAEDAIIFLADQTGTIRRGIISPMRHSAPR